MVSVYALEVALTTRFGGDPEFTRLMSSALGFVLCVGELGMALGIIVKSGRALKAVARSQ